MTHTEILEKLGTRGQKGLGIDESVLEALEEALLAADVGAETAAALTDAVRAARERLASARTSRTSGRSSPRRSRSCWPSAPRPAHARRTCPSS